MLRHFAALTLAMGAVSMVACGSDASGTSADPAQTNAPPNTNAGNPTNPGNAGNAGATANTNASNANPSGGANNTANANQCVAAPQLAVCSDGQVVAIAQALNDVELQADRAIQEAMGGGGEQGSSCPYAKGGSNDVQTSDQANGNAADPNNAGNAGNAGKDANANDPHQLLKTFTNDAQQLHDQLQKIAGQQQQGGSQGQGQNQASNGIAPEDNGLAEFIREKGQQEVSELQSKLSGGGAGGAGEESPINLQGNPQGNLQGNPQGNLQGVAGPMGGGLNGFGANGIGAQGIGANGVGPSAFGASPFGGGGVGQGAPVGAGGIGGNAEQGANPHGGSADVASYLVNDGIFSTLSTIGIYDSILIPSAKDPNLKSALQQAEAKDRQHLAALVQVQKKMSGACGGSVGASECNRGGQSQTGNAGPSGNAGKM